MDPVIDHFLKTVTCRSCNYGWTLRGNAEEMLIAAEDFAALHRCGATSRKLQQPKPLSRWQELFAHITTI